MKKIQNLIILLILLFPFLANAKTCDTNKVYIKTITIDKKEGNIEEITPATAEGKKINVDLNMNTKGDNIIYKIVFNNDSEEDFEIDKNSFIFNTNYINYSLTSEDNSNIVKANSSKTAYLKIEYKNEVPSTAFDNGVFKDNKLIKLNLSSEEESIIENITEVLIKNPNTATSSLITLIVFIAIISIILLIVLKKKKYSKIIILLITLSIIPITVYALCKCDIDIEANINIEDCTYQMDANFGSFSKDKQVRKICLSGLIFENNNLGESVYCVYKNQNDNIEDLLYIELPFTVFDFNNNSYIKIYENNTKENLIKTINFSYYGGYSYDIGSNYRSHNRSTSLLLGAYNIDDLYIEVSEDLIALNKTLDQNNRENITNKSEPISYRIHKDSNHYKCKMYEEEEEGPWITNMSTINKIMILNNSRTKEDVEYQIDNDNDHLFHAYQYDHS